MLNSVTLLGPVHHKWVKLKSLDTKIVQSEAEGLGGFPLAPRENHGQIHPPKPAALPAKCFVLDGEQIRFFNSQNVVIALSTLSFRAHFGCYGGQASV